MALDFHKRWSEMANEIEYEVSDRIARLQINRPKSMNAIHPGLIGRFADQILQ